MKSQIYENNCTEGLDTHEDREFKHFTGPDSWGEFVGHVKTCNSSDDGSLEEIMHRIDLLRVGAVAQEISGVLPPVDSDVKKFILERSNGFPVNMKKKFTPEWQHLTDPDEDLVFPDYVLRPRNYKKQRGALMKREVPKKKTVSFKITQSKYWGDLCLDENFSEKLDKIRTFSAKSNHFKDDKIKWKNVRKVKIKQRRMRMQNHKSKTFKFEDIFITQADEKPVGRVSHPFDLDIGDVSDDEEKQDTIGMVNNYFDRISIPEEVGFLSALGEMLADILPDNRSTTLAMRLASYLNLFLSVSKFSMGNWLSMLTLLITEINPTLKIKELVLRLFDFLDKIYRSLCWPVSQGFEENGTASWLEGIVNVFLNPETAGILKNSDLWRKAHKAVSAAVIGPLLMAFGIFPDWKDFVGWYNGILGPFNAIRGSMDIIDLVITFFKSGYMWWITPPEKRTLLMFLNPDSWLLWKNEVDEFIVRYKDNEYLAIKFADNLSSNTPSFASALEDRVNKWIEDQLNKATELSALLTNRMQSYCLQVISTRAKLLVVQEELKRHSLASKVRPLPFSLLLYGVPNVGKSYLIDFCFDALSGIFEYPRERSNKYVRNATDKYASGYTGQPFYLLDDAGAENPDKSNGEALIESLHTINNVPHRMNMAAVEDKACTWDKTKVFVATTNKKDMNMQYYFSNPSAGLRRFPYVITVSVKESYGRMMDDQKMVFDKTKNKVPLDHDIYSLTVEEVYQKTEFIVGYMPVHFEDSNMKNIDIYLFARWLNHVAVLHKESEDTIFTRSLQMAKEDFCVHHMYAGSCKLCQLSRPMVTQGLFFDYALNVWDPTRVLTLSWHMYGVFIAAGALWNYPLFRKPKMQQLRMLDENGDYVEPSGHYVNSFDYWLRKTAVRYGLNGWYYFRGVFCIHVYNWCTWHNVTIPTWYRFYFKQIADHAKRSSAALADQILEMNPEFMSNFLFVSKLALVVFGLYKTSTALQSYLKRNLKVAVATKDGPLITEASVEDYETKNNVVLKTNIVEVNDNVAQALPGVATGDIIERHKKLSARIVPQLELPQWGKPKDRTPWDGVNKIDETLNKVVTSELKQKIGKLLLNNSVYLTIISSDLSGEVFRSETHGFFVKSNVLILNKHNIRPTSRQLTIVIKSSDGINVVERPISILQESIVRHPKRDLMLVVVDGIFSYKDITKYFLEYEFSNITYMLDAFRYSREKGLSATPFVKESVASIFTKTYSYTNMDLSMSFNEYGFLYVDGAVAGNANCGTLMCAQIGNYYGIVAMHSAGNNANGGFAMHIRRSDIKEMLSIYRGFVPIAPSEPEVIRNFGSAVEVKLDAITERDAIHHVQSGYMRVMGRVSGGNPPNPKSRVVPTLIHESYAGDIPGVGRPVLKSFVREDGAWICPPLVRLANTATAPVGLLAELSKTVDVLMFNYYSSKIDFSKIGPFTLDQAIAGIEGVEGCEPMNIKTSAGPTRPGGKREYLYYNVVDQLHQYILDERIIRDIEFILDAYDRGESLMLMTTFALKDEIIKLTKIDEGRVRCFSVVSMAFTIIARIFFGPIVALLTQTRDKHCCAVGTNCFSREWTDIANWLVDEKAGFMSNTVVAGDYPVYDQRQTNVRSTYLLMTKFASLGVYTQEQIKYMNYMAYDISVVIANIRGGLIQITDQMVSGMVGTSIANSLSETKIQICVYLLAYRETHADVIAEYARDETDRFNKYMDFEFISKLAPNFFDVIRLKNYGDDNIKNRHNSISDWYNVETMLESFADLGYLITSDIKDESVRDATIGEVTFLKRRFRFDVERGVYAAPLELKSIYKSLTWRLDEGKCTALEHLADVVRSSQMEFFQHGREVYNAEIARLRLATEQFKLPIYDYDHWMEIYIKSSPSTLSS